MAIDFTGITNQNEFYTNYYLTAIFEQDLTNHLKSWSELATSGEQLPHEKLAALRRDFFVLQEQLRKLKTASEALEASAPFVQKILNALGYVVRPRLKETESG